MWTIEYGKGRVFQTVLGHDTAAMMEPGFAASFTRGAESAATGDVKPPVEKKELPIRVLVVTGGHDHAPSFYSLFNGQEDLAVTVDPQPGAFSNDLRKMYDVLVLYDMYQDVPEAQRKNLREFLESGKGVLILHHALASLSDWQWWWQDVRAGKYFLTDEPGHPASAYQHDQDLIVEPVGKHPITDGIGAIHIIDETYKHVWISPEAHILLEDESPNRGRAADVGKPVPEVSRCLLHARARTRSAQPPAVPAVDSQRREVGGREVRRIYVSKRFPKEVDVCGHDGRVRFPRDGC